MRTRQTYLRLCWTSATVLLLLALSTTTANSFMMTETEYRRNYLQTRDLSRRQGNDRLQASMKQSYDEEQSTTKAKNSGIDHRDDGIIAITKNEKSNSSNRRRFLQMATTGTLGGMLPASPSVARMNAPSDQSFIVPNPSFDRDLYYPLGKIAFSLLPLAGSNRRATIEECIIPDKMWTHDQIQGVFDINVPVRQTVVRLSEESGGGLWVHNPVAPTKQLMKYMDRLEQQHGPVRHIVLGTVALEHKATLGDFARKFPKATVWVQPGQWAFPVGIPLELLGVTQRKNQGTLRDLPPSGGGSEKIEEKRKGKTSKKFADPPEWMADIDYEILGPFKFQSVGAFSETAFFHKSSKTLLVTDTVIGVGKDPPPIIEEDPRGLLFLARDNATDPTVLREGNTRELRRKGWRRMVQLGLVFFPSRIGRISSLGEAVGDANSLPYGYRNFGDGNVPFGLYPFNWDPNDADSENFRVLTRDGKMFCPPILTKLILNREPTPTLEWVDRVSTRFSGMKRIIPCHLNNNIKVSSSKEFREAFDTLREECCSSRSKKVATTLEQDLGLLQGASKQLTTLRVVAPRVEISCSE